MNLRILFVSILYAPMMLTVGATEAVELSIDSQIVSGYGSDVIALKRDTSTPQLPVVEDQKPAASQPSDRDVDTNDSESLALKTTAIKKN